ncbi:helix-turn-helix domain-containing protein [Chryseolinea lacunae]|uniref:Helix-turn-helix transcriptional regulator n=1 Tax=Chryseolinea lacunae TaxID=2801331 RepID=A0ABS1KN85_9BACT|nr:helix-turn-helix domain-containing protein [Chryseolinea lacunae]MBL0740798.1 helix-turn-helix transcriptional regulator [Chryseolinea lacunae]
MNILIHQLFLVLIYGGIVVGVFIVVLLNTRGVRKGRANFFLSVLLVALVFSVAHILFASQVINHLSAEVYTIGDPTFLLIAPLLWFYACEITGKPVKRSGWLMLHFLPFFVVIVLSLSLRSVNNADFLRALERFHRLIVVVFWVVVVVQFSVYQFWVQRRWRDYQNLIPREVSNTENVSIGWVRFFMGIFLCINLLFLFSLFAVIHLSLGEWLPRATAFVFALSILALSYKGILQREIFQYEEIKVNDVLTSASIAEKEKPDPARMQQLMTYMEHEKPYLDPELTLTTLAKAINITRSQLSQLINEGTGDNFYDFVNKYRVEQVKKLMADPAVKHFNMLGLAMEAGFKSKSTFNLIFKRFTGLTPTEYKKNLMP